MRTARRLASRRRVASRRAWPFRCPFPSTTDATIHDGTARASELISLSLSLFPLAIRLTARPRRPPSVSFPLGTEGYPAIPLSLFLSQGTWLSVSLPLSPFPSADARYLLTSRGPPVLRRRTGRTRLISGRESTSCVGDAHVDIEARTRIPRERFFRVATYISLAQRPLSRGVVLSRPRGTAVARTELFPLPAAPASFSRVRGGSELARALSIKSRVKNNDCFGIERRRWDSYIDTFQISRLFQDPSRDPSVDI